VAGVTIAFDRRETPLTAESVRCGSHRIEDAGVFGKTIRGEFVLACDGKSGSASEGFAAGKDVRLAEGGCGLAPSITRVCASTSAASAAARWQGTCSRTHPASASSPFPSPPPSAPSCLCFECAASRRGDTHRDDPADDKASESSLASPRAPTGPCRPLSSSSSTPPAIDPLPVSSRAPAWPRELPASHNSEPSASCSGCLWLRGIVGASLLLAGTSRCTMLSRHSAESSSSSSKNG